MTTSALYTAADLAFDPASHTSRRPDGALVPHVTEVIGAVGVGEDFDALAERSPRLRRAIEHARFRGTAVHADCHAYDDDDLDWDSVDARVRPFVEAWAEFRVNTALRPVAHARERQIYHPVYDYTGILDGIFTEDGVRKILIDIKNGDPESAAADLQTSAYEAAWNYVHPEKLDQIDERWAVWLTPRNRVPYRIVDYSARPTAPYDFSNFLACLTVYRLQQRRTAR